MTEWFTSLPPDMQIAALFGIIDIVAGWLPDRFLKWPGVILTLAKEMHDFGKEG